MRMRILFVVVLLAVLVAPVAAQEVEPTPTPSLSDDAFIETPPGYVQALQDFWPVVRIVVVVLAALVGAGVVQNGILTWGLRAALIAASTTKTTTDDEMIIKLARDNGYTVEVVNGGFRLIPPAQPDPNS